MFHKRPKALHLLGSPIPGVLLTTGLNYSPGIVPPAAVICRLLVIDNFRSGMVVLVCAVDGSKCKHRIPGAELIVEHSLLRVRLSRQHENWADDERLNRIWIASLRSFTDPRAVLQEKPTHCCEVFGLIVFEIEIESDQGPIAMITVSQCFLDDRTDSIEEIVLYRWLVACYWIAVGYH